MSKIVGTREAAEILGISTRAVVALIKRGTLSAKRLGREWLVDKRSIQAYKKKKRERESE